MQTRNVSVIVTLLVVTGCTTVDTSQGEATVNPVPEAVAAIADPKQDLATARLLADDNCYWYEHVGPVETTLLPLTTPQGNPICVSSET